LPFLSGLPGVDKVISFSEYLKLVNYAMNRFDPKFYALPEENFELRMLMNNYKTLLGEDVFSGFMSADLSKANILLLTHLSNSRNFLDIRQKILEYVSEHYPSDVSWDVTGFGIVVSASSHLITSGQIKSLSLTVALVFLIMFFLFLSFKVGCIAIIPNLFPIITNFGIMGWLGIELSTVTSLIASIAIGLAVDDTIHYLVEYNRKFRYYLDDEQSLKETLRHVGRPIIFTTLTIGCGFSVLALSSFTPTAVFGIMIVITMASALIGDIIILPSLMLHVELITLWDFIRVRLGKDPQRGIPLFKGLSRTEMHYILMAGGLDNIDAGEVLFRMGDQSDSMYAIISGVFDVIVDPYVHENIDKAHCVQGLITRLSTGDIVGEMGLIRQARRSATVVASEHGELLKINWKLIKRLQWLYPPIAHKFVNNLMGIICDRLETATQRLYDDGLTEDMTGICRQRDFIELLERNYAQAKRYGTDLSLFLIGLDFLADTYVLDYNTKNLIICTMCKALLRNCRQCEPLTQLDSQTFGLLLPNTNEKTHAGIAKRMSNLLAELEKSSDYRIGIKLSFGWATLDPKADDSGMQLLATARKDLMAQRKSIKECLLENLPV